MCWGLLLQRINQTRVLKNRNFTTRKKKKRNLFSPTTTTPPPQQEQQKQKQERKLQQKVHFLVFFSFKFCFFKGFCCFGGTSREKDYLGHICFLPPAEQRAVWVIITSC